MPQFRELIKLCNYTFICELLQIMGFQTLLCINRSFNNVITYRCKKYVILFLFVKPKSSHANLQVNYIVELWIAKFQSMPFHCK